MSSKASHTIGAGLPCLVALAALFIADVALSQQIATSIQIQAQSIDTALRELSRQTNRNILFSPAAVQGLKSTAIDALMTAEEAAKALIAGTDLEVVSDSTGALVVRRRTMSGNADDIEFEVIVTALRLSLENAQQIKRNSDAFVDSVTALDINALPDRSVTEALQRVPGVAIDRFTARTDPDHFSIEGSGLSVRGLTQVRSEFNGRDAFTANSGRGLSFQDVSPELMAGVDVYKNQSADLIEGGIGGLINLRTRLPFDSSVPLLAFSADASYADFAEEWTPSYSALYSDRFATNAGEFGLLMNYAYSELRARTDGVQIEPFFARTDLVPGATVLVPRGGAIRRNEHEREREGLTVAGQWASPDRSLIATAQFIRSHAKQAWREHAVEFDADRLSTAVFPEAGTQFEYDAGGVFTSGVLTTNAAWHGGDPRTLAMPFEYGAQHHIDNRVNSLDNTLNDISLELRYEVTDRLALNADMQYVKSEVQNLDWGVFAGAWANTAIAIHGDDISVTMLPPSPSLPASFTSTPASTFWRAAQDHIEDSDGDELAARFDLDFDLGDGFPDALRAGVRYSDREQTTRYAQYNWGWLSEVWAVNPPSAVWFDQALRGSTEVYAFDNFFRGNQDPQGVFIYPGSNLIHDYQSAKAQLRSIADIWQSNADGSDWHPIDQRAGSIGDFLPQELHTTDEQTIALYAMLKFGNDQPFIGDATLRGNIGMRWVRTQDDTRGFESYPELSTPGNCGDGSTVALLNARCVLSPEDLAFGNAATYTRDADGEYDDFLPSLNLRFGLTPQAYIRFAYSKAISRPELGLLRNYVQIQAGADVVGFNAAGQMIDPAHIPQDVYSLPSAQVPAQYIPVRAQIGRLDGTSSGYTASAGNPFLRPMQADQFDLAFEWYFARAGSMTATAFYKDVSNFFINGIVDRDFTNSGVTRTVNVATVTNGDKGKIQGYELTYQQFYDFLPGLLNGFGVMMNYTHLEQEGAVAKNYDTTVPTPGGGAIAFTNVPLEGLSTHNANVVAMYEKGPVSVRLAYNWRSQYLLTTRDVITTLPIYQDDTGQLDATAFFSITPKIKFGAQAVNLTDEVTVLRQQYDNNRTLLPRANFINDRRFSFVLRAVF
jgi:TonB-dependent receptor